MSSKRTVNSSKRPTAEAPSQCAPVVVVVGRTVRGLGSPGYRYLEPGRRPAGPWPHLTTLETDIEWPLEKAQMTGPTWSTTCRTVLSGLLARANAQVQPRVSVGETLTWTLH